MIDPKLLRSEAETQRLKEALQKRGPISQQALEDVLAHEREWRETNQRVQALRTQRNEVSGRIAKLGDPKGSPEGQALLEQAAAIKREAGALEHSLAELDATMTNLLLRVPNPPHASAPVGRTPQENREVRRDESKKRAFDFKPLDHHDLGERLGILDFAAAGRLSGARFAVLKGAGAALERALISFMLDLHIKEHGYTEVFPPFLVNAETLRGTGQLPKFEADLFKIAGERPLYLIPTAEVPVTNLHAGESLDPARLPLRYCAYTACFRSEAGSYGKDTRGLIRQHQFNKVELVWIVRPEESLAALEALTGHAEKTLALLGLPYRVVELCTGDLGFASAKTYDLEVWMAGEGRWREISSCSNCLDFQARRLKTRVKTGKGPEFAHTLNGSGVAVGRAFAAILEQYQQADGSVAVPEVLRQYTGFDTIRKG